MKTIVFLAACITVLVNQTIAQTYPTFGPEKKVTIIGLTFDAMEPFISLDGSILFFNSLNSGGNTNLYYATRINDTTFTYIGLLGGTYDTSANHLDGVASLDSLNNFIWTSLRGYPTTIENLHRGVYSMGNVSNITRVYGNFNIYNFNFPFGWLIMDAAINYNGQQLYYCNAKFDFSNTTCIGIPCESKIGVAQKVNDSTFNKSPNSDAIFSNINDTLNYLLYAPQVTKDGLELYYTRLQKGTFNTEICVAVRNNTTDTFSLPTVIHANLGFIPEAASPATDKQKIYYHQKDTTGIFQIYVRYRTGVTTINEQTTTEQTKVYPNPTNQFIHIDMANEKAAIEIYSLSGVLIDSFAAKKNHRIDISSYTAGIYFIYLKGNFKLPIAKKIIIIH